MKKALSLLLSALLALTALPALAQEYTLDQKLSKQVKDGSGLRMTVTFEKTGAGFSLLDAPANAAVAVLSQGSVLTLRSLRGVGTLKGKEDLKITLVKGDIPLADLKYHKDTQLEALTSSLLGGVGYVDVRDGGLLMALLSGQNPAWPPVEGVLMKVNSAESTWQAAAGRKLDSYTAKLTQWLQGFTKASTQQDEAGSLQNKITITVPADQLKAQIRQLLIDMYSDAELLALLGQELDGRQAAAYLQPGMMNSFFTALDQLKLMGNMESVRIFDAQAKLVKSHLVLPMGGARGASRLIQEYTLLPDGGENNAWTLEMVPQNTANTVGDVYSLSYIGGSIADAPESKAYTGVYTFEPEAGQREFTVGEGKKAQTAQSYNFNLYIGPGVETQDPVTRRSNREDEITLLITPQEEGAASPQAFSLKVRLESGERTNSATSFKGTLTWQDQGTDALITAHIDGASTPPWQIADVNPEGLARVDTMSAAQLEALGKQIQQTLQAALAQMVLKLGAPMTTSAP
jgi:hypothetical protein